MEQPKERILVVESDAEISKRIAQQTLEPLGYRVSVVRTAAAAIQAAVQFLPDLIIVDLDLPGLSGKDLLVALSSQGIEIPIIVISSQGKDTDIIQAFRLGAMDYLSWPIREAELATAVERATNQVRAIQERERLAQQLQHTNLELQRRVRELTIIFSIGKAVTSLTDQHSLFEKIVQGAVLLTQADRGWLLLRQGKSKSYILSSHYKLPDSITTKLNQPWSDSLASLVAVSGEPLSIHGEPLKRFRISNFGQSALVMPVKVKKEVIGILVAVRNEATPFSPSDKALMGAVGDYAAISLVNTELFKALEERARSLEEIIQAAQTKEQSRDQVLERMTDKVKTSINKATHTIDIMLEGEDPHLDDSQKALLRGAYENLKDALKNLEFQL